MQLHLYNCEGVAQIFGEGELVFKFTNRKVTLICKHAPNFNQNVLSISKYSKNFRYEFISDESFEGYLVTCKDYGELLHIPKLYNGPYPLPIPTIETPKESYANEKLTAAVLLFSTVVLVKLSQNDSVWRMKRWM